MTDAEFGAWVASKVATDKQVEGFMEAAWRNNTSVLLPTGNTSAWRSRAAQHPWRALDVRYDQCVGHFECSPERDAPDVVFSVHFSCLHHIQKPGVYTNEHALLYDTYTYAASPTRYWFLRWYAAYSRAAGRLPPPYYTGPPVPGHNVTHDAIVRVNRLRRPDG